MKKGLIIGLVYAGTVIGAGFASGAELYRFFGAYGGSGFFGLAAACVLYAVLGYFAFSIVGESSGENLFNLLGGGIFPKCVLFLNFCFMFVMFCSMTSGAGELISDFFGIAPPIGSFVFCMLIGLCARGGKKDFLGVNIVLTPLLVVLGAYVGLGIAPIVEVRYKGDIMTALESVLSGIIFVSYNILSLIAVIFPFKNYLKCDKIRIVASMGGSMLMFVLGMCILSPMVVHSGLIKGSPLPMLFLSEKLGGGIRYALYGSVLFAAIFTTAISSFFGLAEELGVYKKGGICFFALLILGYLGSLVGFSDIISKIYPFFGILGLLNIVILVYNFLKIHSKNFSDGIL